MHIDSKWKFKEMLEFRDWYAKEHGWNLIVESNMEAFHAGVGPFTHGSKVHTDLMKTQALLHALDKHKFDAAFGGARRDEEKSRAKERIFSFRDQFHQWDPKNQRPELWDIYNARVHKGESIRVFPLSNWTELDIWQYIRLENIPIVPLYFAKERPTVMMDGQIIMPDDDRLPEQYRDQIEMRKIRFRTLGCWPLTGAIESEADTIEKDCRGNDDHHEERTHHPRHRLRPGCFDGAKETRRLLLIAPPSPLSSLSFSQVKVPKALRHILSGVPRGFGVFVARFFPPFAPPPFPIPRLCVLTLFR